MSRYLPTAPYRGTRDFLPPEMSVRQQVFGRLYEVIERYGYARYDGPILESAEIYEAKSGQEIAEQQLYTLTDHGDRRLALRPEMTPSVARMIAGNAGSLQFPVRWYCHVNCHRYERPQRGRVREHWQINVDVFGSESTNCEIEIFELIHDLAAVGATRDTYVLRANDRILLESVLTDIVGIPAVRTREVASLIDRWEKYPREQLLADALALDVSEAQFERLEKALKSGNELLADPRWSAGAVPPRQDPRQQCPGPRDVRPVDRAGVRVLHLHRLRSVRQRSGQQPVPLWWRAIRQSRRIVL